MGSNDQALKSGKDNGDFFPIIQKLMNPVQKKSNTMPAKTARVGLSPNKGDFYLESLRKALLGKGKPLNKISLNSNDLPLLKKFLCQCGFSQVNADNLLKELLQNNPCGEINLSEFFNKITELGPPKKRIYQPITLEPSAIPYIESALRDLGLTPKEVEHVLSGARTKGGQLDLDKFIINLKKKGEKQVAIRSAKQSQLPTDVKATVDRILEKAVIANEKNGPQSPLFSFSKPELTDLHSKEKLSKKGKKVEKESLLSPSKEKGGISAKNGQQKVESSFSSKEVKLFSGLDAGKARPPRLSESDPPAERAGGGLGFNRETIEEGSVVKSETRIMDIPQNISSSTFSESINTVKQNLEPVRDFLPSYLIDQVGKQISRSILRGEKVIRLQLKPPELGTLRVDMDMKDNILKLGMITENNSAKELLLSNIHELREALLEQGIKLDRLDVQINHNFNQSLANSKEGQNQDRNWMPFMAEGGTEDPLSGARNMAASDRLLDLVA